MIDSSRPIAPYLPPEITFRILHFVEPEHTNWSKPAKEHKLFSNFTTINSGWHQSALKRLFEGINIGTLEKLSTFTLVPPEQRLLILSLTFNITNDELTSDDAHNLFLLLKSVSNLKFLSFSKPVFSRFNSKDDAAMRKNSLLPKLITFKLQTRTGNYDRDFYDPIFVTAPKFTELALFAELEYQGIRWSPKDFKGRVWKESLKTFTGLEELIIDIKQYPNQFQFLPLAVTPFLRIIGDNCKYFKQKGVFCHSDQYSALTVLTTLDLYCMPPDFTGHDIVFPPGLKYLNFGIFIGGSLPISNLQLETLTISILANSFDLSNLPKLSKFTIGAIAVEDLLESMINLEGGNIPFEKLYLGKEGVKGDVQRGLGEINLLESFQTLKHEHECLTIKYRDSKNLLKLKNREMDKMELEKVKILSVLNLHRNAEISLTDQLDSANVEMIQLREQVKNYSILKRDFQDLKSSLEAANQYNIELTESNDSFLSHKNANQRIQVIQKIREDLIKARNTNLEFAATLAKKDEEIINLQRELQVYQPVGLVNLPRNISSFDRIRVIRSNDSIQDDLDLETPISRLRYNLLTPNFPKINQTHSLDYENSLTEEEEEEEEDEYFDETFQTVPDSMDSQAVHRGGRNLIEAMRDGWISDRSGVRGFRKTERNDRFRNDG